MKKLRQLFDTYVKTENVTREEISNYYGHTQAIIFESIPSLGKKSNVFAYLGIPKTAIPAGGFPAIVLVHGGGGIAFHEWVEYWNGKGYVALAFDTGGRQFGSRDHDGKGTAEVNPNGRYVQPDDNGSFGNDENTLVDSWTYYNVANIVLANNILRENEYVNKNKIGLTGISWGGVLTAIASGIDDRFIAFAPVYGTGYLLTSQVYTKENVPRPNNYSAWQAVYDPQNYVSMNKKPLIFTLGMDDAAFSPQNAQMTYEKSKGTVLYSYRFSLPHYHRWQDDEQMIHISRFMDHYCKNVPMTFHIVEECVKNGNFLVKLENEEAVKKVTFNYTLSQNEDCMLWKWESIEASLVNGMVSAKIPDGMRLCFFEFSNGEEAEFILSSSIQIAE